MIKRNSKLSVQKTLHMRFKCKGLTLFLAAICLISIDVSAQKIKKFSNAKEQYVVELQQFFKEITTGKEKEQTEAIYNEFTSNLSSGMFSEKEFAALVDMSNTMLKKRVVEFDTWEQLLRTMLLIHQNEDEKLAEPWLIDLEQTSRKESSKGIRDYIQNVYLGLSQQVMFTDGNLRWQAIEATWEFNFETEATFNITGANVWGFFKNDSTIIEGTNGVYFPRKNLFNGHGGNVYWVRTGLGRDSAFATLSNYSLATNKASFEADSVMLYSKLYLNEQLLGSFEERLSSRSEEKNASFPRFTSYNQDISIKGIYPSVDFSGGISVIGSKFYGSGTPSKKAKLIFTFEGKPVVSAQSERILLRQDLLVSDAAQITVHLENDSIYHPKSSLKFIPANNQLTLNRDSEGLSATPYTDSYHDLDIYFELFSWKLNEPQFHLGSLSLGAESTVIFESENYYRGERMQQIKGLDEIGPLVNIQKVTDLYGRKTLTLEEMARGLNMQKDATHRFMLQMSIMSFVNYDQANETITVKDKLYNYIQNERGRRDYDVIRFNSGLNGGANATVSLLNNDMVIRGIAAVALSDSQEVALFPKGRQITVHEGLDFDFDGRITAGRFSFWGTKFFFDYDLFQMNMATIDSMRFKVPSFTADANGNRKLIDVKNVLQDINGELLIDKPQNKSGKTRYTEYPIFRSGKESYVYYDRATIFDSVYNRTKFYVTLEPFEIDSLDNANTSGIKFAGTLSSAGIFPDIDEDIMVQEDYSLGFKTTTPPGGYPGYGGKGRYDGAISLSNKGFQGDGVINYLTSTTVSNSLLFFPDSTNGIAQTYEILEQKSGVQYPHVTASEVKVNWRPYNDVFYTKSQQTPFAMYDDIGMKATGTLALGPTKLGGNGRIDYLNAQNDSKDFIFKNREFTSQEMAFRVRVDEASPWGFELKNARGFVNFNKEKGEFTVNDSASYISFPINQYIAFMDFAEWFIPQKSLEVQKRGAGAQSHMVSVHPRQDSLQFMAGSAKFSLVPSLLEGFEVPKIDVADASIIPDTGYVAIEPAALMRTLKKATIIANRQLKHHTFFEATVDVKSRKLYRGSGYLEYIDEDETPWPLYFESIKPDTSGTTIGLANVKVEDGFFMSPFFAYYGKVALTAPIKNMTFDGYTLIQHACPNIETTWFKFKSVINPQKIVIVLPEDNLTTRGDNLYNGIYLAPDSTSGYSAFLSRESAKADQEIIGATGVLYYDKASFSYIVTSPEKVEDPAAKGNFLALNNKDCFTTGKGAIAFADKAGRIELASYGIVTHDLESDAIQLDMLLGFDFFFNEDILKSLAETLQGASDLKGTNNSREAYKIGLDNILTPKERAKYDEEVSLFGASEKVPKPLRHTLTFNEIVLEFNAATNSFVSTGPIGIGSILDEGVNKQVFGIVEIMRKRKGDEIYIYLEVGGGDYYFFQYKRNVLQFYTTQKEVMAKVLETDTDKRSLKAEDGKPPYVYNAASKGKVNLFLQRFEE